MKQAIALAGGGTKGAYQVGAWKAMRELGIPFAGVYGACSTMDAHHGGPDHARTRRRHAARKARAGGVG